MCYRVYETCEIQIYYMSLFCKSVKYYFADFYFLKKWTEKSQLKFGSEKQRNQS